MSSTTNTIRKTALPILIIGSAVFFALYFMNKREPLQTSTNAHIDSTQNSAVRPQGSEAETAAFLRRQLAQAQEEISELKKRLANQESVARRPDRCGDPQPAFTKVPINGTDPNQPLELPTAVIESCAIESMLGDDDLLNFSHLENLATQGSSESIRLQAINGIAQVGDAEHLPLMDQIARNDPSRAVRAEAMEAAAMLGGWEGIDTAVNVLANDPDSHVANRAMKLLERLSKRRGSDIASRLEGAYTEARGNRAFDIARTLERMGHPASLEREKARLTNIAINGMTEPGKITAIRRIARVANSADRALLQSIADDEQASARVRAEARKALEDNDQP